MTEKFMEVFIMGMVVRTNTMSNNAYRQLGMNNTQLFKSLEKLSSGFRISRAGGDSSGLAISEKDEGPDFRPRPGVRKLPGRHQPRSDR